MVQSAHYNITNVGIDIFQFSMLVINKLMFPIIRRYVWTSNNTEKDGEET